MHLKNNTDKFHPYLGPEITQLQAALFFRVKYLSLPQTYVVVIVLIMPTRKQIQGRTVAGMD